MVGLHSKDFKQDTIQFNSLSPKQLSVESHYRKKRSKCINYDRIFHVQCSFYVSNHIVKLQIDHNIPPSAVQHRKILKYLFAKTPKVPMYCKNFPNSYQISFLNGLSVSNVCFIRFTLGPLLLSFHSVIHQPCVKLSHYSEETVRRRGGNNEEMK